MTFDKSLNKYPYSYRKGWKNKCVSKDRYLILLNGEKYSLSLEDTLADDWKQYHLDTDQITNVVSEYRDYVSPNNAFIFIYKTFDYCKLAGLPGIKNVIMKDDINVINDHAFGMISSLRKIKLPRKLVQIGISAFNSTSLKEITIPKSVKLIKNNAFFNCNLKRINILGKKIITGIAVFQLNNDNLNVQYSGSSKDWDKNTNRIVDEFSAIHSRIHFTDGVRDLYYQGTSDTLSGKIYLICLKILNKSTKAFWRNK